MRSSGPPPFSASGQSMNERQAKALAYVHQNQRIRSRDYQELAPDVSPETLRLDPLTPLSAASCSRSGKRGTYYILK